MKSHGLFSRVFASIIPAVCLLFLIGAPLAHAQQFSFPDFSSTSGLQLNGNATVFQSNSGAVLRLTPASGTQNGSAFYTTQLPLKTGFSTTFTFQFTNGGGSGGHADGIAFLIQNAGIKAQGFSGGAIGYGDDDSNQNHSLGITNSVAIEFDTYANGWDNGNNNHIAVMSCGAASNNQHHGQGGCASGANPTIGANFDLNKNLTDGAKHTVIVTYQPPCNGCQNLTVQLDGTQVLAVAFDLASLGLDPTDDAFVGFTGSTGGGFENQDILSWSFGVTVVQTFNTTEPTTADFSQGNIVNTQTLDLSKTVITCQDANGHPITCPTTTLSTTNTTVPAGSTWPQYVGGTPFATSVCAARPSNGTGDLCSLFVNACFGGTVSQSQASDFFCPFATPGVQNNNIVIKDTWDPLDPKPDIAPGTTVSLIDFVPSSPSETWSPTSVVGATNPVCTNVFGPPAFQCDISDSLTDMFGDQTTTRGTKPKKGWIVSVFNVPMLTTTWSVIPGDSGCPTAATALNTPPLNSQPTNAWFNGACLVQFEVDAANPSNPINGFVAAPPASITYGANSAHVPVIPGDQSQTNGNLASPWTFSPGTLQAVINLINGGGSGDGTYVLHWSAVDNVGISEKHIQLIQPGPNAPSCYNPESEANLNPPCYNTDLFTTDLNMDSVAPAASCAATDSNWHNSEIVVACTASDVTSGIGSATPTLSGVPAGPGTPVNFTLQTSVGAGNANGNASTNTQQLWDLAMNETDKSIAGLKVDRAFPTISTIVLSPSGTYTVGQKVTATFTCADVGSGLVAPCLGTGGVASGGFIDTSSPGSKTFTVTATDVAGNITNSFVNYTVNNAPSADVALFEQPGSAKRGSSFNAIFWALDLSNNAASNVNITATLSFPAGVLGGNVTAKAGIVSCTLLGCTDLTAGTNCNVASNTSVSCTFTSLPSVFKLNGAAVKITIPISANATVGSKFTVSGIVSSANDPNSKNNTASQTFTVSK